MKAGKCHFCKSEDYDLKEIRTHKHVNILICFDCYWSDTYDDHKRAMDRLPNAY